MSKDVYVQFVEKDKKGRIRNVEEMDKADFIELLEIISMNALEEAYSRIDSKRFGIFVVVSRNELGEILSDVIDYIALNVRNYIKHRLEEDLNVSRKRKKRGGVAR